MPHPSTQLEIVSALESNARSLSEFFSAIPEPAFFDGDPDHWSPAHHLAHLTRSSLTVQRALASGTLPPHPTGQSRTYAEVRDAAASTLGRTPRDRLLEMGRTNVLAPGVSRTDLIDAFGAASASLQEATRELDETRLDRESIRHPLIGPLTVREMLFFCVFHERHHLRIVQVRIEGHPSVGGPAPAN